MDANEVLRKFQEFDKDKNGFVSVCEAETILKKELGFTAESTRKLVEQYDKNNDGRLSYEEFIWFYWRVKERKDDLVEKFKKIDKDGSQTICFEEARQVLKDSDFSDEDIKHLFALHDTNQDGVLQFEEFLQFWQNIERVK
ncbi:DgyrCDS8052 [Dimorphilus gyrociliatus]|uniref:DgyrCDS8052 n=1 Tax=Dimorphilus gyrociliatus TaxID=2664684 RepID=A0A7I8VT21_9ANNE|nr:DgyrCDS8052 [Dimorphilus gyrociliatus]